MPPRSHVDPHGSRSVREVTMQRLLRHVAALQGEASQARIAKLARLSPATVSTLIRELEAQGAVGISDDTAGRRGQRITVRELPGLAIGVELGQDHIAVCVRALAQSKTVFAESSDSGADRRGTWLETTIRLITELIEEHGLDGEPIISAGLGIPAPVLPGTGEIFTPAILHGWEGARPGQQLSNALTAPVAVDNEANLAAYAEYLYGAGRDTASMIYLKMSLGVGSGIVTDGRIMRGWRGVAGEVGHLSMDPAGLVCRCGNRGCLETLISSAYLLEQATVAHRGFGRSEAPATIEDLIASANRGDPASNRIFRDAGRHIGRAIATFCIVINPECVVLGGQLGTHAGDLIIPPVRESFENFAIKESSGPTCKIRTSELGEKAPATGALAWGLLADTDYVTHPYARLS